VNHIKEHVRHWTRTDFDERTERLGLRNTHVEARYVAPIQRRLGPGMWGKGIVYRVEAVSPAAAPAPAR
jgi:hypothetical protein